MNTEEILAIGRQNSRPQVFFVDTYFNPDEIEGRDYFSVTPWEDLRCDRLAQYFDMSGFFSPAGFRYLLPGFVLASVREKRFTLFHDAILSSLNTGFGAIWLSDELHQRWSALGDREFALVDAWLNWLVVQDWFDDFDQNDVSRILVTLSALQGA